MQLWPARRFQSWWPPRPTSTQLWLSGATPFANSAAIGIIRTQQTSASSRSISRATGVLLAERRDVYGTFELPNANRGGRDNPVTNFTACTKSLHDGIPDGGKPQGEARRTQTSTKRSHPAVIPGLKPTSTAMEAKEGGAFGFVVAAAMMVLYLVVLKPTGVLEDPTAAVRAKVESFGASSPPASESGRSRWNTLAAIICSGLSISGSLAAARAATTFQSFTFVLSRSSPRRTPGL